MAQRSRHSHGTQVQLPAPAWQLTTIATVPGNSMPSSDLLDPNHPCSAQTQTQNTYTH